MKNTKQCSSCKTIKNISEFNKDSYKKDGLMVYCRSCHRYARIQRRRTKDGLVDVIYSGQKHRSKKRGYSQPTYTKEELKEWLFSQTKFHVLFNNWKRLDYQKMYVPSVDRKDDYCGYEMGNIQLMTWGENKAKGHKDRVSGLNNKVSKAVTQFTLDGEIVAEYFSMREAERVTGVQIANIISACKGRYKTAGGFKWKYKTK